MNFGLIPYRHRYCTYLYYSRRAPPTWRHSAPTLGALRLCTQAGARRVSLPDADCLFARMRAARLYASVLCAHRMQACSDVCFRVCCACLLCVLTAWSKAVRNAMLRGGAEHQRQKALDRAGTNWNKTFLISTDIGLRSIGQAASAGAQGDLMDNERWGRRSCSNSRKQKTGIDRLPLPGQLSSCCGMVKARLLDQLKCGTRGQEKASQVSDYVLISMRETATHDRMFYLLYMYNSFSSQLP